MGRRPAFPLPAALRALPVLLVLALPLSAKNRSGVLSTDFDGKPSGARYIGLGESGASLGGMPESPVWNPASLHDLPGPLFSADFDVARQSVLSDDVLLQGTPLRGRKLTYLGFATTEAAFFYRPLASFSTHTVTNAATPLTDFTDRDLRVSQFGFAASVESDRGIVQGINLSFLTARRGLAEARTGQPPVLELADGNGFSLDIGVQKRTDYVNYGLVFFNIPGILYWNRYKPDQLPVLMRGGLTFKPIELFGFTAEYEKRFYRGGLPKPDFLHLGMELTPLPWLQVRGGTFGEDLSDVDKTFYTAGFSVASPKRHQLDFALRTYRVQKERVYNYFISLIFPLPETSGGGGKYTETPARPHTARTGWETPADREL